MTENEFGEPMVRLSRADVLSAVADGRIVNDTADAGPAEVVDISWAEGSGYTQDDVDAIIYAEDLTAALLDIVRGRIEPHPVGLVMRKTVIDGPLDLKWMTLGIPLRFDACVFQGSITLDHAALASLTLMDCGFEPEGPRPMAAIDGRSLTVRKDLTLRNVRGLRQLFLLDAEIGEMALSRSTIVGKTPLEDFRTVIDGAVIGRLELDRSLVDGESLLVPPLGEPATLTVGSLKGVYPEDSGHSDRSATADSLASWIRTGSGFGKAAPPYAPHVWEAFAQALDRDAQGLQATRLRILGRRFGRSKLRPIARPWDWILDRTIGYGYRNQRALLPWLALLLIAVAVTLVADVAGQPSSADGPLASIGAAILYSLNVVLSPVGTSGTDDWFFGDVGLGVALVFSALKVSSIALLGLFVSGVTGLVSRR